jgi:hypothetical protein
MATEFSRLYRELCHSGPDDPIMDLQFTNERKKVLKALGYDIKSKSDNFRLSKHHGKGARRRQHEARLNAISSESDVARKKELAIRALSRKTTEVNELTTKIQGLLAENKFVSNNLWAKYDKIYGEHTEKKSRPSNKPKAQSTPTIPRTQSTIRFDYSKNKWSKEERDKLNNIYWDLKKPSAKNMAAWENYFLEFAAIFRIFYNERSESEVVQKVKDLYATRQFEEKGESEYWSKVQDENMSPKKSSSLPELASASPNNKGSPKQSSPQVKRKYTSKMAEAAALATAALAGDSPAAVSTPLRSGSSGSGMGRHNKKETQGGNKEGGGLVQRVRSKTTR